MALTPTEIDALPNYSNAQMAKLLRVAIAELGSNPEATVTVGGRTCSLQDLDKLRLSLGHFEQAAREDEQAAALNAGGGCPVVRFQEPQA